MIAVEAPPASTVHVQPARASATVQMPHLSFVTALTAEAYASAVRAGMRRLLRLKVKPHLYLIALHPDRAVSRKR